MTTDKEFTAALFRNTDATPAPTPEHHDESATFVSQLFPKRTEPTP